MMADNLEQNIEALNREKQVVNGLLNERKELVASVSHELKTPITTIANYLEATRAHIKNKRDAQLTANLEAINQEVMRLNLIINDLFDLSRAEVGRLTIHTEECAVDEIVRQVIESQKTLAWQKRHVELVSQVAAGLPPIRSGPQPPGADPEQTWCATPSQHTRPAGSCRCARKNRRNKLLLSVVDRARASRRRPAAHLDAFFTRARIPPAATASACRW
jgi:signal transduction histidine kinase